MIPAPLVIVIGGAVCFFLARRLRQTREPEIFWALVARIYPLALYVWITMGQNDFSQRQSVMRLAWTLLFTIELIHHVSRTEFYARVARYLGKLSHAVHRR